MIILKLLSTACVLGALFMLVVWTIRVSSAVYLRGQSVAREPNFHPPEEMKQLAIVSTAAKYGISFIPRVRKWEASNTFGVANTLRDFDNELIKGGIRAVLRSHVTFSAFPRRDDGSFKPGPVRASRGCSLRRVFRFVDRLFHASGTCERPC